MSQHLSSNNTRKPRKPREDGISLRSIVGFAVSVVLILLLTHPNWLPISAQARATMKDLTLGHFLIERSTRITLGHVLTLVLSMCVLWVLYFVISLILRLIGARSERASTVTNLLRGVLKYLFGIIALVWGLSILGVNTSAVLAGVGIIGLVLGFGAQSLIEDIITGFFIIFEGEYGVGDIIVLDDFRGIVRDVGVRTTVIEDTGGNLKVINNSDIRNFQNRSRKTSLAICLVGVAYDTDLMALEQMLKPALEAMYEPNKDLYLNAPQYLGVEELADSGVVLKITVDCREVNIFRARRRLNRDIRVLFAEKGVEIPFPQVVVHQGD